MTEVLAQRAPLQTLSMSSTQRSPPTRRRSARLAFDEEDEKGDATTQQGQEQASAAQQPPPKKPKLDADDVSAPVTARGPAAGGKKTKIKASYDEDADGFQFSRAPKTKKAPPKRRSSTKQAAARQDGTQENAAPAPVQRKRTSQQGATPNGSATSPPKRRSARLSGEKAENNAESAAPEQLDQPIPTDPPPETRSEQQEQEQEQHRGRARTPQTGGGKLQVEKMRPPTKIALPFADTPVILRNKEMRKTSSENRRRSSSQMRGRRASSLMDSGTSNALPHSEVDSTDFYMHIHQDLPEPRRMKQLLVWCGTRALPEKPSGSTEDVNAALAGTDRVSPSDGDADADEDDAARVIQEELLQEFSNKSEMSDWFSRDEIIPAAVIKKPNPRNVQNSAKLQELEGELSRLRQEKATWEQLLGNLSSTLEKETAESKSRLKDSASADASSTSLSSKTHNIDTSLLSPSERTAVTNLTSNPETAASTSSRLQAATKGLEFKIDSFAEGMHRLDKYKETADGVVHKVLGASAQALEERDRAVAESVGTEKVPVRELLRSLSRSAGGGGQ